MKAVIRRAGFYRDLIEIQQETRPTPDGQGGGDVVRTTIANGKRRGKVLPAMGREKYAGMQLQGEVSIEIKMPFLAGVGSHHVVAFGSRIFEIQGVTDWQEMHVEQSLWCLERQAT